MESFQEKLQAILSDQLRRIDAGKHHLHVPARGASYVSDDRFHYHPVPELFIQLSGLSRMETPCDMIHCRPHELMLMPIGTPHSERACSHHGEFRNIVIAFGRRTVSIHEAQQGPEERPHITALEQFVSDDVTCLCNYLSMAAEWHSWRESPHRESAVRGLLAAFFSLVLYSMQSPTTRRRKESFKVAQCRRMVSEHLADASLSVRWLAERLACAPDYLSHLFHKETGGRLSAYINDKRVAFACDLLGTTSLNIAEVSQACGYSDRGYMSRQFRRHLGVSPRVYRQRLASPV